NPANTNFEIRRSSSPSLDAVGGLDGVVSTVTIGGTSIVMPGLFPASTYYFQIRSINTDGLVSAASLTVLKAVTNQSGSVSSSTSPYSTYAATTGAVAV